MLRAWTSVSFSRVGSHSPVILPFSILPCSPPFSRRLTRSIADLRVDIGEHSPHLYATSYVVRAPSEDFGLGNSMVNEVYRLAGAVR